MWPIESKRTSYREDLCKLVLEKLLLHCQRPGLELGNLLPFAVDGEPKDGSRPMGVQDRTCTCYPGAYERSIVASHLSQ
jgi:hypothetical protein